MVGVVRRHYFVGEREVPALDEDRLTFGGSNGARHFDEERRGGGFPCAFTWKAVIGL